MGVDGGVRGGTGHRPPRSYVASIESPARGERGVGNVLSEPVAATEVSILGESEGRDICEADASANKVTAGAGERSAKGSSSSKSDGGELRNGSGRERVSGIGGMGMAGGRTYDEVDAAAEWDRSLVVDVGVGGAMIPSAAMAD